MCVCAYGREYDDDCEYIRVRPFGFHEGVIFSPKNSITFNKTKQNDKNDSYEKQ